MAASTAVEALVARVVELLEGSAVAHLDSTSLLSMLALALAGAGLVTLQNASFGGRERLPLLVGEPFPRLDASVGVVPAPGGINDSFTQRLRRHTQHPAVDAVVVVTTSADTGLLPREIEGVPVRLVVLRRRGTSDGVGST